MPKPSQGNTSLVYTIPGGGGLTFDDSVREMPQADSADREHIVLFQNGLEWNMINIEEKEV